MKHAEGDKQVPACQCRRCISKFQAHKNQKVLRSKCPEGVLYAQKAWYVLYAQKESLTVRVEEEHLARVEEELEHPMATGGGAPSRGIAACGGEVRVGEESPEPRLRWRHHRA